MQTKLEVTLTSKEAEAMCAEEDYTTAPGREIVVGNVIEQLSLDSDNGAWVWKVGYPKDKSGIKLTGRFVTAGAVVIV